ncbi:molybdopterin-synthase adenylyltransferase MoeB [Chiayiivirga flava]|uniref:Molybdopterin-synthase adenylyltransferase n=1 Tax=Chiayiivirga flava TaxID=659595 RepID=A0A7W8D5Y1_9GAMM|nr:molybdopterin-synthase adenylyltransferase MoeB [Chiayiivirga flava]MBB5208526.1 molybdopterin/thiamine biosynthesis adenylyltransferase [Chiayiivirga flava]
MRDTAAIEQLTPRDAFERVREGARLIDVREDDERAAGVAQGADGVPLARLLERPQAFAPLPHAPLLLICASGARSLRAAQALAASGYARVASVAGGTQRWLAEGLPMASPVDADFLERYSRHLLLPQVGFAGQRRLEASRVLLVGAGGLGSPVAFYLAAAGVGTLRISDDDHVDRSNLQRQILHTEARVGVAKVASAQRALNALNPRVRIEAVPDRVTSANIDALLADADVAIDGSDSFAVRYLLSDACVKHAKPLVYGAVQRFDGQVSVFDAGRRRGAAPCYRCLFPQPPRPEDAPNCAEAGVLGVLPGIVGLLQANEAIKLLLGIGDSLDGRLLSFDALATTFRETRLRADPDCPVCAPGREFPGYIDYGAFCRA